MATRKVEGLLAADAQIKVISSNLGRELQLLVESEKISFIHRPYRKGDLAGAYLAIAATNDLATNRAVWEEAVERGCLVNVVDDPEHSNFIMPATLQRGEMTIAVSTGGGSPALARRVREKLEDLIGPEYGVLTELLAELRPELLEQFPAGKPRLQAAIRVIDSNILDVIRNQGKEAALVYAKERLLQNA